MQVTVFDREEPGLAVRLEWPGGSLALTLTDDETGPARHAERMGRGVATVEAPGGGPWQAVDESHVRDLARAVAAWLAASAPPDAEWSEATETDPEPEPDDAPRAGFRPGFLGRLFGAAAESGRE